MTPEQFNKLPKWAQEEFTDVQRERDVAVRELNEWVDSQTVSPISIGENVCTGETQGPTSKTRYIQGHEVHFKHAGVNLRVNIFDKDCIRLQWETPNRTSGEVAFIPASFQYAKLVSKANMRT